MDWLFTDRAYNIATWVVLIFLAMKIVEGARRARSIQMQLADLEKSVSSLHEKVGSLLMRSGGLTDDE